MVKREFLFRKLLQHTVMSKNDIPNSFITTPNNPILLDFKSILHNNSYVENLNENSRTKSLMFVANLNSHSDDTKLFDTIKLDYDKFILKKSQYKHMRKSISNMIRIQADNAVAMPTDTRIQILTVSRDIIHS